MSVTTARRWVGIVRLVSVVCAVGALASGCASGSASGAGSGGSAGLAATPVVGGPLSEVEQAAASSLAPAAGSFLAGKSTVTSLGSTTPANGDVNPYAIWPVTQTVGSLHAGDVLVDNFNNKSNNQGTGTTIVDIHPDGQQSVFADLSGAAPRCPGGVGLTTAMVLLRTGWLLVGSLPSTDGKLTTAGAGCLLVVSATGKLAGSITGPFVNGPWDTTVVDNDNTATLFVANTLVGLDRSATAAANQGNVVRVSLAQSVSAPPRVVEQTQIADGFAERADAGAFVKGPTGLVIDPAGTLYVADNLGNRIAAIPNALTRTDSAGPGKTLSSGGQLANPLGLVRAPNGDLLAANATNGKIVEITPDGRQVGEYYAIQNVGQDPPGNGDLFDVAINQAGNGVLFVKDDVNTLAVLH